MKFAQNEKGIALLQVMLISVVLIILAYALTQLTFFQDRASLAMINRGNNLNLSLFLSDQVNSRRNIKSSALILQQVGTGALIEYP